MPADSNIPFFPLQEAPPCKKCGRDTRRERRGDRFCWCCPCSGNPRQPTWCTWDDAVGITPGNPLCDCGFYCRISSTKAGKAFETCSLGCCNMTLFKKQNYQKSSSSYQSQPISPPQSPPRQTTSSSPQSYQASPIRYGSISSNVSDVDDEFVRLLQHVSQAAQRVSFPSAFMDLADMSAALRDVDASREPSPASFRIQSSTEFEKHSKIGAAGELFVFRFLQKFTNDDIYISDWQSNMRNLVKQHPSFKDWPDWKGAETSDIVYPDDHGRLTSLLIDNGYLASHAWKGKTPEYFIEVKSTLSDRNREFYLSSNQYSRMQQMANPRSTDAPRPRIYMIARVSNMQENNVDLRLYLDPEDLRNDGKLKFRQVWVVEDVNA